LDASAVFLCSRLTTIFGTDFAIPVCRYLFGGSLHAPDYSIPEESGLLYSR